MLPPVAPAACIWGACHGVGELRQSYYASRRRWRASSVLPPSWDAVIIRRLAVCIQARGPAIAEYHRLCLLCNLLTKSEMRLRARLNRTGVHCRRRRARRQHSLRCSPPITEITSVSATSGRSKHGVGQRSANNQLQVEGTLEGSLSRTTQDQAMPRAQAAVE